MLETLLYLTQTLGPRPAHSPQAAQAAQWISQQLLDHGLKPAHIESPAGTTILACSDSPRDKNERLFLAHSDSVPDAPGAIDNAAAVAILLEFARLGLPPSTCIAFPAAEEIGLKGSIDLARRGIVVPRLVVALDLVGHGTLSVTGLGPAWGDDSIAWLVQSDIAQIYGYRAMSRALPGMERSDHAPFARPGVLTMQLLGRGPYGVYPDYHTPNDTADRIDPAALERTLNIVRELATRPLPDTTASPAFSAWGLVIPGRAAQALAWIAALVGLWPLGRGTGILKSLGHGLAAALIGGISAGLTGLFYGEAFLLGAIYPATAVGMAAGWLLLPYQVLPKNALSGWICTGMGLLFSRLDLLMGLPWLVAGALLRGPLWPLSMVIPTYLLIKQPELHFHGLLPAPSVAHLIFWVGLLLPFLCVLTSQKIVLLSLRFRMVLLAIAAVWAIS